MHTCNPQVHERSVEIDLLLLLLRDVVVRRAIIAASSKASQSSPPPPPLRVVLMSATANAQLFADYMEGYLSNALRLAGLGESEQCTKGGLCNVLRVVWAMH